MPLLGSKFRREYTVNRANLIYVKQTSTALQPAARKRLFFGPKMLRSSLWRQIRHQERLKWRFLLEFVNVARE